MRKGHGAVRRDRGCEKGPDRPFAVRILLCTMLPAVNSTDEYGQNY